MVDEEAKLLQAAAGYKGSPKIKEQLIREAETDGLLPEDAEAMADRVIARLGKSESGKKGGAFGTPHKAEGRYAAIKKALNSLY
jgi:hypothetical protein